MKFIKMHCIACSDDAPHATESELRDFLELHPKWHVLEIEAGKKIQRLFTFYSYQECLDFTVKVGELAEIEDHHPDLYIQWGKVTVTWWTHRIQGLHQNDLIMAAKTEALSL
tara:strand:- start:4824 stop:5159 length:336 start_codon:yes stop_codon:yes gene_type:complete